MTPTAHRIHTIDELKLLVAPVAEKYGCGKIYLFGSVARGDHDEGSDYDFCIELGKIRGFKLGGFFMDLKDAVGNEIDLVTVDSIGHEFLNKILRESVILYEA
ncbi:MAG: nucleotidyltransferase domain-containing protein [Methanomassiliicoccaceae archaeon]|jgi:predicted nucleotidyltransferase|nr:nucleotidyltransferase domain-containing protein [Methanomassiliicoccaceae archaeon]